MQQPKIYNSWYEIFEYIEKQNIKHLEIVKKQIFNTVMNKSKVNVQLEKNSEFKT